MFNFKRAGAALLVSGLLGLGMSLACQKDESEKTLAPFFTTQPASLVTVGSGSTATFTAVATGTPAPTFQWERRASSSAAWTAISGATSATYSFTAQKATDNGAQFQVKATNSAGSATSRTISLSVIDIPVIDLGPNVLLFDPSMPISTIQSQCSSVFTAQKDAQFGSGRKALLFLPGTYEKLDIRVGFYTQVLGLGASPDEVNITGTARSTAYLGGGNATCNFWRGMENFALTPQDAASGVSIANMWAVAQATPFRRMHIKGSMVLSDTGDTPWSSGGLIADSVIDANVNSGSQQQWLTRNSELGSWSGSNWNMVFLGVDNAPSGSWPSPPYTKVDQVPVLREKPFLRIGSNGYEVFVPALRTNTAGASWSGGDAAGTAIPLSDFHIAKAGTDTAATMNAQLAAGKHLFLTPGIYHLSEPLAVTRANTVVLGIGFATLTPDNGVAALNVADVDGVKIAGLLIDAGATNSPVLMEVGPSGSSADHSANPTSLHDIFCRVGGAGTGKADVSLRINSHNVIGDHFWIWRADHGDGVGWTNNTSTNGLVVNGDDITIYGLFVEHYHQYQTVWNGERGRVYMYQSEIPYDVPDQASWRSGQNGYASYKVADGVTQHEAWGLGIYSFFSANPAVKMDRAIEVPVAPGVKFHHMITVCLGSKGEITHVINNTGAAVNSGTFTTKVNEF